MAHHTPISEQRRLVASWRRSGQSMAGFARSVGVGKSTFWRWTRQHGEAAVVPATPKFVELVAAPAPEPVSVQLQVQVQGSPAVLLTFDALPDATWLGAVVREVIAC